MAKRGSMNKDQAFAAMYRFFLERAWPTPNVVDCSRFVMQEAAEVDSALMKAGYQSSDHARNNPLDIGQARTAIKHEIGQVYGMVVTLANLLDFDLTKLLEGFLIDTFVKRADKVDMDMVGYATDAWLVYNKTGDAETLIATLDEWKEKHEDHNNAD